MAEAHTFFVGEAGWLVHNQDIPDDFDVDAFLEAGLGFNPRTGQPSNFTVIIPTLGTNLPVIAVPGDCIGNGKCDSFAREFMKQLPSNINPIHLRIESKSAIVNGAGNIIADGANTLGYNFHEIVVVDGYVFDNFTYQQDGPIPLSNYMDGLIDNTLANAEAKGNPIHGIGIDCLN